jgi:dolichyl-phosphate beta-glucosyltransferase
MRRPSLVPRLRRFAAVGLVVTLLDIGLLTALRLVAGVPVVMADAVSVGAACAASFLLHRRLTLVDDPYDRWVDRPRRFVAAAAVSGVVDVAVLRLAVIPLGSTALLSLVAAKLVALVPAGTVRVAWYRRILLEETRRSSIRPVPRQPARGGFRLSVVVPAYGEGSRIAGTVASLRDALACLGDDEYEIVVVDDGSDDDTAAQARAAGADQVVRLPSNRGKGAAVRAGVLRARGRTIAYTDADLAYPPAQLLRLLVLVEEGWDVVVGSRRQAASTTVAPTRRLRVLTGRGFNLLTALVLLGRYRDTQCGLKAFRSDVARVIFGQTRLDRFAFDVEVFHLAERHRLTIAEAPVELALTTGSTVRVAADSLRMVADLLRVRVWAGRGVYDLDAEGRALLGMERVTHEGRADHAAST